MQKVCTKHEECFFFFFRKKRRTSEQTPQASGTTSGTMLTKVRMGNTAGKLIIQLLDPTEPVIKPLITALTPGFGRVYAP